LGGRGLPVLGVWPGAAFNAMKQTVAFGIVDLLGYKAPADAHPVQRHVRIRFNVVVPSWISVFTEVRGDEDDAPSIGEEHQRTRAGPAGLGADVRHNDGGERPNGGNSPPREPEQSRIDAGTEVTDEPKTRWRDSHPTDDPMGN